MTTEIVNTTTGEMVEKKSGFSPDQVELVKKTVCRGATDDELMLFLHICQRSGLDPFAKQIYAIKRQVQGRDVMTFQTSIDGYRAIAERTGCYAPGKEATYVYDKEGALVSATAYINKKVGGQWFEVSSTAHYAEYCPKWWDSKKGEWKTPDMWVKMPHAMLAKCAESAVLRRAFPNEMSGTYTQDEMSQADTVQERHVAMPKRKGELPAATEIVE
jgi:phage recombination protein Bet